MEMEIIDCESCFGESMPFQLFGLVAPIANRIDDRVSEG